MSEKFQGEYLFRTKALAAGWELLGGDEYGVQFAASARPSLTLRAHEESSVNGGKLSTFSISKTIIHTRRHKPLGLRVFVRSEWVPTPDQAIGLLIEEGEVFHEGENTPEECIVRLHRQQLLGLPHSA